MKHEPTRTNMKRDFTDLKTAEDRLNKAGRYEWTDLVFDIVTVAFIAGLTGLVFGALSALL